MKNTTIYFTGKVLNVKELASDNAKSFRFSKEERAKLDLRGIPIKLEHEDSLEVGQIQASWNGADNQHWVFGKMIGALGAAFAITIHKKVPFSLLGLRDADYIEAREEEKVNLLRQDI